MFDGITEPVAKVMLAWGIPGTAILIEAYLIYWLFGKLTESQEKRVTEAIDMIVKYEDTLNKVQMSLDAVISLLKENDNGK